MEISLNFTIKLLKAPSGPTCSIDDCAIETMATATATATLLAQAYQQGQLHRVYRQAKEAIADALLHCDPQAQGPAMAKMLLHHLSTVHTIEQTFPPEVLHGAYLDVYVSKSDQNVTGSVYLPPSCFTGDADVATLRAVCNHDLVNLSSTQQQGAEIEEFKAKISHGGVWEPFLAPVLEFSMYRPTPGQSGWPSSVALAASTWEPHHAVVNTRYCPSHEGTLAPRLAVRFLTDLDCEHHDDDDDEASVASVDHEEDQEDLKSFIVCSSDEDEDDRSALEEEEEEPDWMSGEDTEEEDTEGYSCDDTSDSMSSDGDSTATVKEKSGAL